MWCLAQPGIGFTCVAMAIYMSATDEGYSTAVTRMPFSPGENAVQCYLCRKMFSALCSIKHACVEIQHLMNRNQNILNLKKLSNTIGKINELEVNPAMSKKRIPEMWALQQFTRPQVRHMNYIRYVPYEYLAQINIRKPGTHVPFWNFKQQALS